VFIVLINFSICQTIFSVIQKNHWSPAFSLALQFQGQSQQIFEELQVQKSEA